MKSTITKVYRLAVLNSHPIQYFAPLYKRIAQEPDIDLTVYYCIRQGLDAYNDPQFGTKVQWDIPLLDGYQYKFLPNLRVSKQAAGFTSLINPAIVSELYTQRYDALWIHGHNYATYLLAIAAAKLLNTSVFMRSETHLLLNRAPFKRYLRQTLMTAFYKTCDVCLPIGSRNAEFYRFHKVPKERLFRVPYTVDNEFFRQMTAKHKENLVNLKQELGLPADKVLILYASKLINRKHPFDLLMAYERLSKQGVAAALLYVGSGVEEAKLRNYVEQHQIQDVFFFGFQNQSELPKFYACADLFVLPSENEPWGLVINEVMACGLPVITTEEVGAAIDLIQPGETGFTYPARDVDMLTQYLKLLVEDKTLRERCGRGAFEKMSKWSFEECVDGLRAALQYISNSKKSKSFTQQLFVQK